MEEIEDRRRSQRSRCAVVTRYYATLQLLARPSSRLWLMWAAYCCLQHMTLLLPPSSDWQVPWNYSVFWPAWYILNCAVRTDHLLLALSVEPETLTVFFASCLAARMLTAGVAMAFIWTCHKDEIQKIIQGAHTEFWGKNLLAADQFTQLLFSQVLAIPLLSFLATAISCSHPTVCLDASDSHLAYTLAYIALPPAVLVILCDRVAMCDIRWERRARTMSKPRQEAVLAGIDVATCVGLAVFSFESRAVYCLVIAFILGLLKVVYIHRELPFHSSTYNAATSCQGAALVCETALLSISLLFDKSALMPSLSLFLLMPMVACYIFAKYRSNQRVRNFEMLSEWQQELILRQHILTGCPDHASPKTVGMWTNSSSTLALLWSAYFYLAKENLFCLKLLIAQLWGARKHWTLQVSKEVCIARVKAVILCGNEERVVHDFLKYTRLQEKVINLDFHSTFLLRSFYEKLLHRHVLFQELATTAQVLSDSLQQTISIYQRILHSYKQKKTLLQAYYSLLIMLGKHSEVVRI